MFIATSNHKMFQAPEERNILLPTLRSYGACNRTASEFYKHFIPTGLTSSTTLCETFAPSRLCVKRKPSLRQIS